MPKRAKASSIPRGTAGRRETGTRSDLYADVEIVTSGGRNLNVTSKVEAYYGDAIRQTAEGVLDMFGIEHATVVIEDAGALSFAIAARVETALRRAGCQGHGPPQRTLAAPPPTARDRVRRSRLYLPGNEPKFMINAGLHRPDAVILDLEDSVHPDEKDAARVLVRNALRCVDFLACERMVRINQLPLGHDDLDEVVPELPHLILIPKTEHADQVREVDARVRSILSESGAEWTIWLMPIVESALGVENAFGIATATDSIAAITIGLEDYTADLGVRKSREGAESLYARTRLVNAAHAAGVQAIDSVYGDVGDPECLRAWALASRALGFEGMGCIHPRQIEPIHQAFAPTSEEIERALKIVAAYEEAEAKGLSVVSLGTRMIDPPVVRRARRLVASSRRMGLIDDASGAS